jgi:hypothetical protein
VGERTGVSEVTSASAPSVWLVVATALFALLVTTSSFVKMATGKRHVLFHVNVLGTIVHEAGHALVSIVTGGGVYRFEVASPDSGATIYWYPSKFSVIATSAAGYAMPSLAGLGAAWLLHRGQASSVLTLTVATLVLLLLVTRDLVTLSCVLAVGVLTFAALYWGKDPLRNLVGYTEAWLLLTSEIGGLAAIIANRFQGFGPHTDDAASLAAETHIPALAWIVGWSALIGWALWQGAGLLWP